MNDPKEKRWYELRVEGATDKREDVEKFFQSFRIEEKRKMTGTDIGKGSPYILGDEIATNCVIPFEDPQDRPKGSPPPVAKRFPDAVKMILNPRARFTDSARRRQVNGKVVFQVTFAANGSIADIKTQNSVDPDLRDQSVAAAMKMVFLPAKKDGKVCTSTKTVQYQFSIY